jgi:hypothetical protein
MLNDKKYIGMDVHKEYVDRGAQFYDVQQRTRQFRHLKQKAAKLGIQLVQAPAA